MAHSNVIEKQQVIDRDKAVMTVMRELQEVKQIIVVSNEKNGINFGSDFSESSRLCCEISLTMRGYLSHTNLSEVVPEGRFSPDGFDFWSLRV